MLAAESREFWAGYQVESDSRTVQESLNRIARRKALYPGIDELMPLSYPGKTILDFGCGPGSDTIAFLLNGAEHVHAVDISPRALNILRRRLILHGLNDHCTLVYPPERGWWLAPADHIHLAGVLHHCSDPTRTLQALRKALNPGAEIRMMVYDADSWFYRVRCGGNPARFRELADEGAPIVNAWTQREVRDLAAQAGLTATYLGSYRHPGEPEGPGLSACYSLRP